MPGNSAPVSVYSRKIPVAVLQYLERGFRGELDETPKPSNLIFQKVQNIIVGTNQQALEAAKLRAEIFGLQYPNILAFC